MGNTTARRVLRSEDLPRPRLLYEHSPARTRREASATTVPVPTIRRVAIGGSEVLVTRLVTGEVVAFVTNCPHQGTPLEGGSIFEGKLRCPRHQYLYDLRTGQNIFPSSDASPESLWKLKPGFLPVHAVEEREGWVWVRERPEPPPPGYDPRLEVPPGGVRAVPVRTPPDAAAPALEVPSSLEELLAQLGAASESQTPGPAGDGPPQPPPETVEVIAGEEFELVLPTRFSPACIWKLDCTSGEVSLLAQTFEEGSEPRYRLRLVAPSPGEAVVCCIYARPWDRMPKDARAYRILARPSPGDGRSSPGH